VIPAPRADLAEDLRAPRVVEVPGDGGQHVGLLAREVALEVAAERGRRGAEGGRELRVARRRLDERRAERDDARDGRPLVGVLAVHRHERRVHLPIAPREPRQDRLLLVPDVERERLAEPAPDARRRLGHLRAGRRARLREPRRELRERADPAVALEQEGDDLLRGGSPGEQDGG